MCKDPNDSIARRPDLSTLAATPAAAAAAPAAAAAAAAIPLPGERSHGAIAPIASPARTMKKTGKGCQFCPSGRQSC